MLSGERVINIIYALFFYEERRLQSEVNNRYTLFCQNDSDLLCIENYKQSVQRFEDFKALQAKVFETLKRI